MTQKYRRVVVTGMGLVSPLGHTLQDVTSALKQGKSTVVAMPEWASVDGLACQVASPVAEGLNEKQIPRTSRRSMGKQAIFAAIAAQKALKSAELNDETVRSGRTGVSIGSTMGSPGSLYRFYKHYIEKGTVAGIKGTAFLECMGHTCAANLALLLGVTGRVMAPLSACTSGSQGIGTAYEAIRFGRQDAMICGGADEAHFTAAVTFDLVRGASAHYNDAPSHTPRPFDAKRDGIVVSEGSGILVLESLEHATARKAPIVAELIGYQTTSDGTHISQPQQAGMELCMRGALAEAQIDAKEVGYINAHATGTPLGDPVEAAAIGHVFGDQVPVSSTKGQMGHALGACGALESIFTILMMREGFVAKTQNLEDIDESCRSILHIQETQDLTVHTAMNNNFAFGGVNTSLIFRRYDG